MIANKGRAVPLDEKIGPSSCALVVVDVQNDFCHPDGLHQTMGEDLSRMPAMVAQLEKLVAAARKANILIVWVRATYEELLQGPPMAEVLAKGSGTCARYADGSWGADWFGNIRPQDRPNEIVVSKHRASAFWDTPIDLYLRSNGVSTIVVAGVATSGCVESTVRDAFFRNYYVVLAGDCCGDYALERHEYALRKLGTMFGVTEPSTAIIESWARGHNTQRNWQPMVKADGPGTAPSRTALVLVDLQVDLCDVTGALARAGGDITANRAAVAVVANLVKAARAAGVMVVHVHSNHSPLTTTDGRAPTLCVAGSSGAGAVDSAQQQAGEAVIVKHRASGFVDTGLDLLLRSNGIRTVVLAGSTSLDGVTATAQHGHMLDYDVVVARDALGTHAANAERTAAWLTVLDGTFAAFRPAAEIAGAWR